MRFAHWSGARRRRWIDTQIRRQIESGSVASEGLKRSRAVSEAIEWAVVALTYFIAGILALDRLGLPLTTLVAPATVIGIGLGFGAQQMVGDLLAGFFLFAEHQFAFGDVIRLSVPGQTTGITGTVEELTLRVTKVRTAQGELVVVPNSALRQVTNLSKDWSTGGHRHPGGGDRGPRAGDRPLEEVVEQMAADPQWSDLLLGDTGGGRGGDHRRRATSSSGSSPAPFPGASSKWRARSGSAPPPPSGRPGSPRRRSTRPAPS